MSSGVVGVPDYKYMYF